MSKTGIRSAIERTIEEAREYRQENPDDNSLAVMYMDEHRRGLEANLDCYDTWHPSPLRTIASSITIPAGFILAPAIMLGYIAYAGGMKIYEIIKNKKTT